MDIPKYRSTFQNSHSETERGEIRFLKGAERNTLPATIISVGKVMVTEQSTEIPPKQIRPEYVTDL